MEPHLNTTISKLPMIYVVEDNDDIGFILEYFLRDEGFQVNLLTTATDLKHAMEEALPDLFLMDVMLPDGNGINLCHQIKAASRSRHLPVIMMSAHVMASANCGAEEFIPKPFDLSNLLDKIRQYLPAA